MAFNRRRQPPPRGSYWFAQSGSDVSDCLRFNQPVDVAAGQNVNQQQPLAALSPHTTHAHGPQQPHHGGSHSGQLQSVPQAHSQQQQHNVDLAMLSSSNDWNGETPNSQEHQDVDRVRADARERQEVLQRRRMEELAAHNENAQRIREEVDGDKKRPYQERPVMTEAHRQQVDERRRALREADLEWREAVLRRSQERDLKAEQYRRNRLSASVLLESTQAQPASVMSSPARGTSGDLMSRSMIVTSSAARRKTDLTPVTPSPWARGLGAGAKALTPSRPQTAAGSAGTPKRAVSMSRLDILAQPRRRFTMEDLKSRSHSAWKLNEPSAQSNRQAGLKGMKGARSMSHLSPTPVVVPRLTRTSQLRVQQQQQSSPPLSSSKGHQSTSSSRSEQVSPTHHLSAPHHLRSRSQMSSDLSQSSVASSVGSPHANMRPKTQGSANRKARPLSIAGSIPSSELDRKDKGSPLVKPHKPVPPSSSPEPQTTVVRQRRSASPKKKELSPQKEQASTIREVNDALTSEEMAVPVCSAVPVDIPLLMTQSFTEGCMPIENRPAETRKAKTREEAMAEIAEARRKAREELDRQAEEDRRKREEEAAARRAIQEKRRQLEEEARLKREREEEEKRRQEEEERKAEEERLRQEEEAKRALEEKAKQEAIERQKREEQERLERKKRVEEIMARTRKARAADGAGNGNGGSGGGGSTPAASTTGATAVATATAKITGDDHNGGQQGGAQQSANASVGGGSNESSASVSPVRDCNGSSTKAGLSLQPTQGGNNNNDASPTLSTATAAAAAAAAATGRMAVAEPATVNQAQNGLVNGHSANNGAGGDKNVIETKPVEKEPVSIDNSTNGPASADSGTGSADFNSNSTAHLATQPQRPPSGNINVLQQPVQVTIAPVLPGQATTTDAPLLPKGPLIQDLLS